MIPDLPHARWTAWLQPRSSWAWNHEVAALLVIVLVLLFAGIHLWYRRVPGPLLMDERRAADGLWLRRLANVSAPALALLAIWGLIRLVWDITPPTILVLHSRVRASGRVTGLLPTTDLRAFDLGRAIDQILKRCSTGERGSTDESLCAGSVPPDGPLHDALVQSIGKLLSEIDPVALNPATNASYSLPDPHSMVYQRSLVESLEIAAVEYYARKYHALQVRVAPQPSYGASSWLIAKQVLKARGVDLQLVDDHDLADETVRVRRLAGGFVRRDGTLDFWAIVDGQPKVLTPIPLQVLHQRAGSALSGPVGDARASLSVKPDRFVARIVYGQGRVPSAASLCQSGTLSLRAPGVGEDLVVVCESDDAILRLHVAGDVDRWRRAFDWLGARSEVPDMATFLNETTALSGSRLPYAIDQPATQSLVEGPAGVDGPVLVVVARSMSVAQQALAQLSPAGTPTTSVMRVTANSIGSSSIFSWLQLPVTAVRASKLSPSNLSATAQTMTGPTTRPAQFAEPSVTVAAASDDSDPWVAIQVPGGLDRSLPGKYVNPDEPASMLALLRTVAWAASRVNSPRLQLDASSAALSGGSVATPLLSGPELAALLAERASRNDAWYIGLIGLYLVFGLWRVLGANARVV